MHLPWQPPKVAQPPRLSKLPPGGSPGPIRRPTGTERIRARPRFAWHPKARGKAPRFQAGHLAGLPRGHAVCRSAEIAGAACFALRLPPNDSLLGREESRPLRFDWFAIGAQLRTASGLPWYTATALGRWQLQDASQQTRQTKMNSQTKSCTAPEPGLYQLLQSSIYLPMVTGTLRANDPRH